MPFKGLNASVEEVEIVFIEVKTGRSVLSAREKAVKKAVEGKKVSWRVFNPDVEVIRPVIPNVTDGSSIRCNRDYKKQMRASVTYESRKLLLRQLESAN